MKKLDRWDRNYAVSLKQKVKDYVGNKYKCKICGTAKNLTFHHKNPKDKKFEIGSSKKIILYSWNDIKSEVDKCEVLCELHHRKIHMNKRVILAMSGGVDSSVSAYLLQKRGFEVIGLTLRFWDCGKEESMKKCCGLDATTQAKAVADMLYIPHYLVDAHNEFEDNVLKQSWNYYKGNRTPNPCAFCNEFVKFPYLFKYANMLGADWVATGHYAIAEDGCLYRGVDNTKDQSYFLYSIGKKRLNRIIFPLGEYTKQEVRKIAEKLKFPNALRKESQDLCFDTKNESFPEMLRKRYGEESKAGNILSKTGLKIGEHNGTYNYTIGQRRGLGIKCKPYVIDLNNNDVIVDVLPKISTEICLRGKNIIDEIPPIFFVQTRYHQEPIKARMKGADFITFFEPQYSIAPGQVAVLYDDDKVIGGGIIIKHEKD